MSKKTKQVRQPGDYSPWMVPVWGSRLASLAVNVVVLMQLTYYCTNSLGLSAVAVGTMLLLSKIFDGITDLIAGVIVDKTNTKWGKARPYEISIVFLWISTVMLFSTPNFGTMGKLIYVFALYSMTNAIFATILNATDAVYLRRAIRSEKDQSKVLALSSPIAIVLCTVVSIALPILISMYGNQPGGWTKISLIFAIPFGILGLGRLFFLKEMNTYTESTSAEKLSIKTAVQVLKGNKYIFLIALVLLLLNLISGIGSAVGIYYFQYIYGNISAMSTIGMIGIITPFFLLLMPAILKKYSLIKVTAIGAILGVVGNAIKFIGGTSMSTLIIGSLVAGIGILPISMMINILVIQCMDYSEWKSGIRVEGVFSSVSGFSSKVGGGLASALVGFVMGISGYNGTLTVQSQSANMSIIALFAVVPMILFLLQYIVLRKYDLDKIMPQIQKDLAERRTASSGSSNEKQSPVTI